MGGWNRRVVDVHYKQIPSQTVTLNSHDYDIDGEFTPLHCAIIAPRRIKAMAYPRVLQVDDLDRGEPDIKDIGEAIDWAARPEVRQSMHLVGLA